MRDKIKKSITWCPGCGNFGILKAFEKAASKFENVVVSSGIGCHGKISDYLILPSCHVIHGRVPPFLTGIKLANPELTVAGFVGDGDALNEGIEHLVHAAKRNTDIAIFLHNNGVFGLTTGQVTATSPKGFKSKSTPKGNPEEPLNPIALMLVSGATFVARGYAGKVEHLSKLMYEAMKHKGFSFVEILQPCATFNNTWKIYSKLVYEIDKPTDFESAIRLSYETSRIPIGIFYKAEKESFEEIMLNL